ncbi:hypothetical protein BKH41_07915 [Helicobacter sp. 12S02232-10]|uniref:hypothetical protein n=1 Tax=Helicobacter sp. 12S02232-10 TaxID=1476197 RepID=UPI000BA77B9B|nr:hypothetical protein [Helicobacter sp. 12S02232-10]PAF47197.1 hypothetical protein BKH41_07915 [Helicobacter sp. 12S02232-10]
MAISPIGNVTYINQNTQASSVQQANSISRSDLISITNKEFEDKLKIIGEVRPTEDSQAVQPDAQGNGGFYGNSKEKQSKDPKSEESKEETPLKSSHILDIKV